MSEEKRIMDFFGFGQVEGNVLGEHFSKILTFLKIHDGETWDFVKEVSPLIIHMQFRYIKDNYVMGLIRLGIIKLYMDSNIYRYKWIGEKALNGVKHMIPSEPEQVLNDLKDIEKKETEKETEKGKVKKEETEKGFCPNCGKKLKKNKKFCNQKCLEEYYKKKKEKK